MDVCPGGSVISLGILTELSKRLQVAAQVKLRQPQEEVYTQLLVAS